MPSVNLEQPISNRNRLSTFELRLPSVNVENVVEVGKFSVEVQDLEVRYSLNLRNLSKWLKWGEVSVDLPSKASREGSGEGKRVLVRYVVRLVER